MTYDPLVEIVDEPLAIDASVIERLREYRRTPKLMHLPDVNVTEERERLEHILNGLVDLLLDGVEENPSNRWVLGQSQPSLASEQDEDTEARDHFGMEIETNMDILDIDSSDGLLSFYLGGI